MSTNFELPSFNFSGQMFANDAELASAIEQSQRKKLKAGHHTLQITEAYFAGVSSDPAWSKLRLKFAESADSNATLSQTVLVPTGGNFYYTKIGGKPTLFVYTNSVLPFFRSIGHDLKVSTYQSVMTKLFTKTKPVETDVFTENGREKATVPMLTELVGKVVEVDLGFKGHYIQKNPESEKLTVYLDDKIVEKDGQPLAADSFDELKLMAHSHGIIITNLEIVKFYEKAPSASNIFDSL